MKLVTIASAAGGAPGVMTAEGEIVLLARAAIPGTLEAWLPSGMRALLEAGAQGLDVVRGIAERVAGASEDERAAMRRKGILLPADQPLLAPIPDPAMILAIGQAYHSHVKEMKGQPPSEPLAFIKAGSAVTGSETVIELPPQCPDLVDFEGELCAVIGRHCHNVTVDEAMDHVVGLTIANDVSARDWTHLVGAATTTGEARHAWDLNHMGKQLPGFAPIGPVMVTLDEIGDPGRLDLTTRINGEVMQHANTSDLIFSVAEVVSYFSRWYAFRPGDIISTGTPGGVGYGRDPKAMIRDGDVVEVEVSGIGTLRNRFVAA